jgi:hypothetical protein
VLWFKYRLLATTSLLYFAMDGRSMLIHVFVAVIFLLLQVLSRWPAFFWATVSMSYKPLLLLLFATSSTMFYNKDLCISSPILSIIRNWLCVSCRQELVLAKQGGSSIMIHFVHKVNNKVSQWTITLPSTNARTKRFPSWLLWCRLSSTQLLHDWRCNYNDPCKQQQQNSYSNGI